MTTQEYLKCRRYFDNHIITSPTVVGFKELFTIFSRFGISSYEDLMNSPQIYKDFILNQMYNYEVISSEPLRSRIDRRLNSFIDYLALHVKPKDIASQKKFGTMVTEFISNKQKDRVLDVGAGEVPISSIEMAKDIENVSSMDHLMLSPQSLKKLNVTAKSQYFGSHTKISNYDYIVGKCPCSAIEYISRKCAKENKGYFIQLCNCNLPFDANSWEDVLPEHDKNVKFYMDYAYNLDASPAQVEKLIDKFNPDRHVLESIKPTIAVSFVQDVGEKDWKIDDTPNEVTSNDSTNSKNWEIDECFDINQSLDDDRDLL